ncbi:MAG: PD40 domain-containing protein [Flavobacteriales bacterium]|nr:PD40 domain-containing protein [Flavobacteriales bacterium]MBP6699361.1 PD40 domain-containing protein [Flavobacteriales bacterium]
MHRSLFFLPLFALACEPPASSSEEVLSKDTVPPAPSLIVPGEDHFKSLKQLTFGGDNAEAYWSFGGDRLVFQVTNAAWGDSCDQIRHFNPFDDDLKAAAPTKLSTMGGRTTCSYFLPGDSLVLFASTHEDGSQCPPVPERKPGGKYVWPIYSTFDIYVCDLQGTIRRKLTDTRGYDAEATVSPKGDRIVFTSMRDGDMELYTMNIDGTEVKRITNTLGYDGGAFFSPDGTQLVWRASRPATPEQVAEYKDLLKQGLVQPTEMELFIANADGSDARQITKMGKANWAPYWHPSGKKIIFASNHATERGFPFTLYLINTDGTGLEQVSGSDTFDAFPVFSKDGRYLVFSSNRNNGGTHDTNLFLAEWQD